MSDAQDGLTRLRDLIAEDPEVLTAAAGAGDVRSASAALSRYAASKGISVTPEAVEQAFQRRGAPSGPESLDDDALNKVTGGGSQWCWLTVGGVGGSGGTGGFGGGIFGGDGGSGGSGGFGIG